MCRCPGVGPFTSFTLYLCHQQVAFARQLQPSGQRTPAAAASPAVRGGEASATAAAAAPASTAAAGMTQLVDEPNLLPGWSAWLHVTANGRRYKSYWGPRG